MTGRSSPGVSHDEGILNGRSHTRDPNCNREREVTHYIHQGRREEQDNTGGRRVMQGYGADGTEGYIHRSKARARVMRVSETRGRGDEKYHVSAWQSLQTQLSRCVDSSTRTLCSELFGVPLLDEVASKSQSKRYPPQRLPGCLVFFNFHGSCA